MTVDQQPIVKQVDQSSALSVGGSMAEYLVLLAYEQRIVWHVLVAGKYVRLQPGDDGVLRSQAFPGLWLHAEKFWANDVSGLLDVLQEGLRSPEHAEFVARFQK